MFLRFKTSMLVLLIAIGCSSRSKYGNYTLSELNTIIDSVDVENTACERKQFYTKTDNDLVFSSLRCNNGIWLDTSYYTNGNIRSFRFINRAGGTARYMFDSSYTDIYNRRGTPQHRYTEIYKRDTNYQYMQEYKKGVLQKSKTTVYAEEL